ncbi:molybdopterin-containing oxidoreductase family protein [Sphingosinicella xenopeptidilytica]|uniref:Molybdopterin-dependent oxidoreductase n=1 Tax=Sphingosinicella xenopeptidilytica TaxID=364098 RepID=A0ABW3BYK8_SPHXN
MKESHRTFCRVCSSLCAVKVEVEDNRIVAIRGDRDNPMTSGYFCIKGSKAQALHNGDDRLFTSLKRDGKGDLAPADTDDALDAVHLRLSQLIEKYGPHSVALYFGTGINQNAVGAAAMKDWFSMLGSPFIYSSMTVDQSAKWVTMGRMGFFATAKYNFLDADVLLLAGTNPAVSHFTFGMPTMNPVKWLRQGIARGLKLITVDPRVTETATLADTHVSIRPGEDAAFFAGLIRVVLENGWENRAFCDRYVAGLEALRAAVEPFSLDIVRARTGIASEQIVEVARLFAAARRKSAVTGTGPNMSPHSNVSEHLCEAFNAICGGYRQAGDFVYNTGLLSGAGAQTEQVVPPSRSWERGVKCHSADIGPLFGEYPSGLLADEILAEGPDRLRALIVVGGNPAKAVCGSERMLEALDKLDLLVSIGPRMNDTAEHADFVIATDLMYERYDCTAFHDSILSHSYARITEPILKRPEGVVSDLEVFWGLARRLGQKLMVRKPSYGVDYAAAPAIGIEFGGDAPPSTEDAVRWMVSQGKLTYEALRDSEQGILIEADLPVIKAPKEDDGARLDLCPTDVADEIAAVFEQGGITQGGYRLTVRRMLDTLNSAFVEASQTRQRYRINPTFMNPEDMAAEGLNGGDAVRITSSHGSVIGYVKQDKGLARGVVSITHGWGKVDQNEDPLSLLGTFSGHLVSPDIRESINFMPWQSGIPVTVSAAGS